MKRIFICVVAMFLGLACWGQGSTNLQVQYDFGGDRKCVTTTIEGFYNDNWGNTYFFIDHDFPTTPQDDGNKYISGTYWEIARCLNFWKQSKMNALSVHVEYDGGVYRNFGIPHSFLLGADYFLHSKDYKNTFNFKLLLKGILGMSQYVPLQFTFVWGMQDIFGLNGMQFCGFADIWSETQKAIFLSEPQLWYRVGQHFGCPNLNVGGEVELSVNFGATGFRCRPCLGLKWIF